MPEPITLERLAAAGFKFYEGGAYLGGGKDEPDCAIEIPADVSRPMVIRQEMNVINLRRPRDMEDVRRLVAMMEMEVPNE